MLPLLKIFGASLTVNGLSFLLIAWPFKTEKLYDVTGCLTFLSLTTYSIYLGMKNDEQKENQMSMRSWVNSGMVVLWSLRLGLFLAMRMHEDGKDKRFDGVRGNFKVFGFYFFMQAIWGFITALPVYHLNVRNGTASKENEINWMDYVAWSLWICGFLLESTADYQKRQFHHLESKVKPFITDGVWAWSQHPNYFGEMVMWAALWLSCANGFNATYEKLLTSISPVFIYMLLRYMSGIPLLQKANKKKYGDDPVFKKYLEQTNLLFPNPFTKPVISSPKRNGN